MMLAAISNIAWGPDDDEAMYDLLGRLGIAGLEIAPTRLFPENPYGDRDRVRECLDSLARRGLTVVSMQSIWYGRSESLFGSADERQSLYDYTLAAIDFAEAMGCRNLVFGCPRNRNVPQGANPADLLPFFRLAAAYAAHRGCVIGMEANPPIYHTNYMNTTPQVLELIGAVDNPGFALNLDVGAMLYNGESVELLRGRVKSISHVHISEPMLRPVEPRKLHRELMELLREEGYSGYVSLEMAKGLTRDQLEEQLLYLKDLCS